MKRLTVISLVGVLLFASAAFVWPTLYRPITLDLSGWPKGSGWSDLTPIAARENRFTGEVELLTSSGWVSARVAIPPKSPGDSLRDLARRYQR